jgi:hypothetical protein
MEFLDIFSDIKRELKDQEEQIDLILKRGQVKDMEQYKFLLGQLHQIYNMHEFMRSYKKMEDL